MALTAVLEFGDNSIKRYSKQYLVADCRLDFVRSYNQSCPEGSARCEKVEVSVIAPGKDDFSLFKWYAERSMYSGRLIINLLSDGAMEGKDAHILYFEDAQCFSLSETYDIDKSRRRLITLGITADVMEIDGTSYLRR